MAAYVPSQSILPSEFKFKFKVASYCNFNFMFILSLVKLNIEKSLTFILIFNNFFIQRTLGLKWHDILSNELWV
jgi:hypothetical protein